MSHSLSSATSHHNWPMFILLAMLPVAAIFQGLLAFWTEHFQFSLFGMAIEREGDAAQMLGLVTTSLGWMALWALSPMIGAPKRAAIAMSSLAVLWTALFFALA